MTENIFEQATRQNLRFDSPVHANLTTEQLWTLPLQTARANQTDLDGIGKLLLKALREQAEDSLITPANNAVRTTLELKLAVVKHIIEVRQAEAADKVAAASRDAEKARLKEILETKRADALGQLSVEEIEARLKALG